MCPQEVVCGVHRSPGWIPIIVQLWDWMSAQVTMNQERAHVELGFLWVIPPKAAAMQDDRIFATMSARLNIVPCMATWYIMGI